MTSLITVDRPAVARARAKEAQALLAECRFCAHDCGVNRLIGERGLCHAGPAPRFFGAQVEVTDELELIPTFSVALSGCDLRCAFCITGHESWTPQAGISFDASAMAARAVHALANGARTVMVLGGEPTIHLPAALEFVSHLPADVRLIWKTNAHGGPAARALLENMFDIWLADFKFGNDLCAQTLARVSNYTAIVRENLRWAWRNSELIVRHLLMPGHFECCWQPVAEWLATELPGVKVNLRTGFWPAWQSRKHAELRSTVAEGEAKAAIRLGEELGLNLIP